MLKAFLTGFIVLLIHTFAFGQYRPKYLANVGGNLHGPVRLKAFQVQQGVGAERFVGGNEWQTIRVDSFRVTILRGDSTILNYFNIGNTFTELLKTYFGKITAGDRVLIYDIWALDYGQKKVYLPPLEYLMQ
jgi:hypothetical protein